MFYLFLIIDVSICMFWMLFSTNIPYFNLKQLSVKKMVSQYMHKSWSFHIPYVTLWSIHIIDH